MKCFTKQTSTWVTTIEYFFFSLENKYGITDEYKMMLHATNLNYIPISKMCCVYLFFQSHVYFLLIGLSTKHICTHL